MYSDNFGKNVNVDVGRCSTFCSFDSGDVYQSVLERIMEKKVYANGIWPLRDDFGLILSIIGKERNPSSLDSPLFVQIPNGPISGC